MEIFLNILMILGIIIVLFFVITFIVYFFNLDMKLTSKIQPLLIKHYNKHKSNRKI